MPKRGQTQVVDGKKRCKDCGLCKPVEEFDRMNRLNRPAEVYYQPRCKPCKKIYHRDYYRARRAADPTYGQERNKKYTLKKHGLTVGDFERMLNEQGGRCAICGAAPGTTSGVDRNRLVIDHDHVSGRVRALLCDFCNRGLGVFKDDPDLLLAAAIYVSQHREVMANGLAPQ